MWLAFWLARLCDVDHMEFRGVWCRTALRSIQVVYPGALRGVDADPTHQASTKTACFQRVRVLRVIRRECRTSLSANRGCWYALANERLRHAHPGAGMLIAAAPSGTGGTPAAVTDGGGRADMRRASTRRYAAISSGIGTSSVPLRKGGVLGTSGGVRAAWAGQDAASASAVRRRSDSSMSWRWRSSRRASDSGAVTFTWMEVPAPASASCQNHVDGEDLAGDDDPPVGLVGPQLLRHREVRVAGRP